MANRQRTASRGRSNSIPVIDTDGERIGWVLADHLDSDSISIETGLLFPTKVQIPRSWVKDVSRDRVTLSKTRRDVEQQRNHDENGPFHRE